jgi:hypothetical protein
MLAVGQAQSGTLIFTKPAAWTNRAPASSMRVAERWTSQFQSKKEPIRTTTTVNGLKLTSLDVSGTYVFLRSLAFK